ncbi:MAG: Co-chaperone protein DjlA [Alphaproteobacteria bacterium MarineAlpha5_Bin9]|nr:MAG: Co-chaperone protein DjlA [Alphaproteobacteria bacterium MarineAlpha5_Bin9]|tara:strand:- start:2759 stop:3496 length:738 start_codon:yes stop_codon:yes gene_type:complete
MSIWGKVIGGIAGFSIGGPLGAILGVMAGNIFDKKSIKNFNYKNISNEQKQSIFAFSIIVLSAKLAKSDGTVTKDEINAFKEKFKIPKDNINKVSRLFNEAKKSTYGYEKIAQQISYIFSDNKIILEELLNNLFYIAEADGNISKEEVLFLKNISNIFGFNDVTFERIYQYRLTNVNSDPFKTLGVKRSDSNETIRKAWLQIIKEHHPDNLISKGMPKEFIDQANKELSSVNNAYDKIKKLRNIK